MAGFLLAGYAVFNMVWWEDTSCASVPGSHAVFAMAVPMVFLMVLRAVMPTHYSVRVMVVKCMTFWLVPFRALARGYMSLALRLGATRAWLRGGPQGPLYSAFFIWYAVLHGSAVGSPRADG